MQKFMLKTIKLVFLVFSPLVAEADSLKALKLSVASSAPFTVEEMAEKQTVGCTQRLGELIGQAIRLGGSMQQINGAEAFIKKETTAGRNLVDKDFSELQARVAQEKRFIQEDSKNLKELAGLAVTQCMSGGAQVEAFAHEVEQKTFNY